MAVIGELPGLPGVAVIDLGGALTGIVCGGPMLPSGSRVCGGWVVGGGVTGGWVGGAPCVGNGGMSALASWILAGITPG